MLKGNKGEWSEIYTFFKLLAEGKLYGADSELNKKDDIFYDIYYRGPDKLQRRLKIASRRMFELLEHDE